MKVLSIGNSFSEDAQRYLHAIAENEGLDLFSANLYIGGCSLELHYNNLISAVEPYMYYENAKFVRSSTIKEGIAAHDWDVITLQQASHFSYKPDTYYPYIMEIVDYIRRECPRAKIYIHQTWSYGSKEKLDSHNMPTHADMFARVELAYQEAAEKTGADGIIYAGQTLERLQNRGFKVHRDGYHASFGFGRFAISLTWLGTLLDFDVTKVSFNEFDEPINENEYKTVIECVKETLSHRGLLYPSL